MEWLDTFMMHPIVDALGWTLVHFIWQGLLIGSIVYIILSLMRNQRASTRYLVLFAGMIFMVAAPIRTFIDIYETTDQAVESPAINTASMDAIVEFENSTPSSSHVSESPYEVSANASTNDGGWISNSARSVFGEGKITSVAIQLEQWFLNHLEWLVIGWVVGLFLMAMRLIGGFAYVQWIRHYKATPAGDQIQEKMERLKTRLGINEQVELLKSVRVKVPMVIGWMKPAILLPTSMLTGLTVEQIESIIAHELAHIRRYDYLINIFQLIVETLFFYHPMVWWMSNQMRIEREHSCDDLAVSVTGDAMNYARALTNLEELRAGETSGAFAMAATDGSLLSRIRRIMGVSAGEANQSTNWMVGLVILAGLVSIGATYANDQLDHIKNRMATADQTTDAGQINVWSTEAGTEVETSTNLNYNYNYNYNTNPNASDHAAQLAEFEELSKLAALGELKDLSKLQELAKLEALQSMNAEKDVSNAEFWAKYGEEWGKKWGDAWGKAWSEANAEKISAQVQAAMEGLGSSSTQNYYDEDGEYTVEELIEMKKYGVTREYIDALKKAGYDHLSAEALIDFKKYGVTLSLIEALQSNGFTDLEPEELVDLAKYDVSVSYINQIMEAKLGDISIDDVVDMKKYGADIAFIQSLQMTYFLTSIDATDVVDMAKHGVDAQYIQDIRDTGFGRVNPDDIVDMKKYGVKPDLVAAVQSYGIQPVDIDDLTDMAKHGVDADYLNVLQDNDLTNLSAEEIIDMKKYGVDIDYIKTMRKKQ
ncbi:MAG: M56 family metallopeptidase [Bacteroidota bacterium]